jgi:hypothetical protein
MIPHLIFYIDIIKKLTAGQSKSIIIKSGEPFYVLNRSTALLHAHFAKDSHALTIENALSK